MLRLCQQFDNTELGNIKCQRTIDRTKSGLRKPFDVVKAENNQKSKNLKLGKELKVSGEEKREGRDGENLS